MATADQQTSGSAGNNADTFAALFEASTEKDNFAREGEIVQGRVVQVDRDYVVVDVGGKSEGIIALKEFGDAPEDGSAPVAAGDVIDVYVESRESDDGLPKISKEKADRLKVWDARSAACAQDQLIQGPNRQPLEGRPSGTIKGGVTALAPRSRREGLHCPPNRPRRLAVRGGVVRERGQHRGDSGRQRLVHDRAARSLRAYGRRWRRELQSDAHRSYLVDTPGLECHPGHCDAAHHGNAYAEYP